MPTFNEVINKRKSFAKITLWEEVKLLFYPLKKYKCNEFITEYKIMGKRLYILKVVIFNYDKKD